MTEQEQQQAQQRAIMEEILRRQHAQQQANVEAGKAQQRAYERQQAIDQDPHWKYAVIAAVDLDRGFSKAGEIPWYYKEDLQWFKMITTNHICVMGRTTYEDINKRMGDKAKDSVLPSRQCFVVSSTLKQEDVHNATVIQHCYDVVNHLNFDDIETKTIFFIGGERIFKEGIALAKTVYLTVVNKTFECDKFFPVEYVEKYFILDKTHQTVGAPDLRFFTYVRK
jgi:dihydrofolate reductase